MIIEYEDNELNRALDNIINKAQEFMKALVEQYGRDAIDSSFYKAAAKAACEAMVLKIPARYIFAKDEIKPMAYLP